MGTSLPNVKLVSGALSNISNLSTLTSLPNLNFSNITSGLSATTLSQINQVGTLISGSIPYSLLTGNVPIWNQNTTGSAAYLATSRNIYGNSFDGTANVTGVITSTYGGTGNGFVKLIGPATSEKTFTLPNASATILTSNAAVTIAQGGTGLTAAGNDGEVLTSNAGTLTWAVASVREAADEFPATASQTSFTLTETPATKSKIKMYVNGFRISNTAYSVNGTTITYTPSNNNNYVLITGDLIQFDYSY